MNATLRPDLLNRSYIGFVLVGVVVAIPLIGAALIQRGPDPAFASEMASAPIELPDGNTLFVQRFEVTVAEWNACFAQNACSIELRTRPDHNANTTPATGLNYVDVQDYVRWISDKTGHAYRLPTSGEWAFMAQSVLPEEPDPIFSDPELSWASSYLVEGVTSRALKPQGSFSTSPDGIADLDGSVWEWTTDCYSSDADLGRCPAFYVGGEHLSVIPYLVRDPARGGCAVGSPPAHLGMRLVTDTRG